MKQNKKIAKGKFAVIKKNGKVLFTKKAEKGLRIEGNDSLFEVEEKTESKLTKAEKDLIKQEKKNKSN